MRRRSFHPALGSLLLLVACAQGSAGAPDGGGGGGGSDGGPIDAPPRADVMLGAEICDGMDNDGDQFVDEGSDVELCGEIPGGVPVCRGLMGCAVESCNAGFYDLDLMVENGCECADEATENQSTVCEEGVDLGALPDTDMVVEVTGVLTTEGDVDIFRFLAVDTPDTTCDAFHVRAQFLDNANDQFQMEVLRGGCAGTQLCAGITDLQWYTNFADALVPHTGQCPCQDPATPTPIDNATQCLDDGAEFVIKVTRRPGMPVTCDAYRIEISNGRYPPPP